MSEAADAEREVENFFNEEIFNAKPEEERQDPFPVEAPPEPKPLEEVVIDPEVGTPPDDDELPPQEDDPEQVAAEIEEAVETPPAEDEYVAWAKKQYGEDLDLDNEQVAKLAKASYEKEKLLGRKAEEARQLQEQASEREIQERIAALNDPGILTPEEDAWVDEAVLDADPGRMAWEAYQADRPDLYAAVMDRWSSQGEAESRRARSLHSQVVQFLSLPQPSEQEAMNAALDETFQSVGLDRVQHGPMIAAKLNQMGPGHWTIAAMQSPDPVQRSYAIRAALDLINAGQTTVEKAKTDDVVAQRVQEEKLRQNAAGVQQGGPRVEQPKKSAFWSEFDKEIEEQGWDGNRPTYGRDE